jgi:hypothetical protein
MGAVFVIIAIVVVFVVLGVLGHRAAEKRREALLAVARQLGLRCHTEKDYTIPQRYRFLDALRKGSNQYAYNLLEGMYEGHSVKAFDYHYETHSTDSKGKRKTHHHRFSYFILEQELRFPELRIYPEGFFAKLGQMVGFDDIDFESVEFSKAFCVRSKDKKFAYDICNSGLIEYLLDHKDFTIEIEEQCVALSFDCRLVPEMVPNALNALVAIRSHFPEYLYRV